MVHDIGVEMNGLQRFSPLAVEEDQGFEWMDEGVKFTSPASDFRDGVTITISRHVKVDDSCLERLKAKMVVYHRDFVAPELKKPVRYQLITYNVVRL